MEKYLICFLLLLSIADKIHAQHTYYFSSKAGGEGNGTMQHPFVSLHKLNELALQAGDTVFFGAGEQLKGNILLNNISGTKAHPVVFTSFGKEKCIVDGGNKAAFIITNSNYIKINHLALTGVGRKTGNATDGLKLMNCKNAVLENISIHGFQKSGLLLYNCEQVAVSKVVAYENGFAGILVEGDYQKHISDNIHIVDCNAYDNPGDPTALDNHSGNGILVGNSKNVLVEFCTATNNGWDMPRVGNGPVGIWAYEADSVTIQHCIAYRNKTAKGAADGGGFDLDGGVTNSTIQYCLSYENWGSGYGIFQYGGASKWHNNTVRYCISINDGSITDLAAAMLIWNGDNGDTSFTNFTAYNNVFYNDKKYAFSFHPQSAHQSFSFFNNVFIASDTSNIFNGIDISDNDVFAGNVWMKKSGGFKQNGFTNIVNWVVATGYEQSGGMITGTAFEHSLFTFPTNINITNPHLLKTDSLLLTLCNNALQHTGVNIKKLFAVDVGTKDFFGHTISPNETFTPGVCDMK